MARENSLKVNVEDAQEICRRIDETAEYEVKDIITRAEKEAEKINQLFSKELEEKRNQILASTEKEIEKLKERIFSTLNLEKKKVVLEQKSQFIDQVFDVVNNLAKDFRLNNDYKGFIEIAILEGIEVIDDKNIDIYYSSLDSQMINESFKEKIKQTCLDKFHKDFNLQFKPLDFEDIGIILQSNDGRLNYDNRFSLRLKRVYDAIYMRLLRGLFRNA